MKFNISFLKVCTIVTLSIFCSCNSNKIEKPNPLLLKCWIASYEESNSNIEPYIYRPCDYKDFTIIWYRNSFTLKEDWTCEFLVLAPNDAHYFIEGTWELNESNDVITLYDFDEKVLAQHEIIEIEEDLLLLN
jgi:hypothetical protein